MRHPLLLALTLLFAAPARAGDVPVQVYADVDGSALSDLAQGLGGDDWPVPGLLLRLARGAEASTLTTDADGRATFAGVGDGSWLLRPVLELTYDPPPACTSHNVPSRLTAKLLSGDGTPLVYVALGDSSPKIGSSEGRPYPVRLKALLDPLLPGGVTLYNQADPGTVTADWLPGATDFEQARGAVASADLITLTLGGNDMQNAVSGGSIANAPAVINQAIQNLKVILAGLREVNPTADLVVTVYPNYSKADVWLQYVPSSMIDMLRAAMETAVKKMRTELASVDGVLIGDVYGELQAADMNLFMYDALHVNDLGHAVYAQVIFRALGGVVMPDDAGRERAFGLALGPLPDDPPEDAADEPEAAPEAVEVTTDAAGEVVDAGAEAVAIDAAPTDDVEDTGAPESEGDPGAGGGGCSSAPGGAAMGPAWTLLAALAMASLRGRLRRRS